MIGDENWIHLKGYRPVFMLKQRQKETRKLMEYYIIVVEIKQRKRRKRKMSFVDSYNSSWAETNGLLPKRTADTLSVFKES